MAFNPFVSFRKNQKVWIFGVLFVCMVSFVLCSGEAGKNIADNFSRFFAKKGDAVITLNDSKVNNRTLYDIKKQRVAANIYMRECTRMALMSVSGEMAGLRKHKASLKPDEVEKKKYTEEALKRTEAVRQVLIQRLKNEDYFGSGTKLEELADFMLWKEQADKLGIYLDEEAVILTTRKMLFSEFFFNLSNQQHFGHDSKTALAAVQSAPDVENRNFTLEQVYECLEQEYRVQIAKICLTSCNFYAGGLAAPNASLENRVFPRISLTPHQLYQDYEKRLTQFDVTLIPVSADTFAKEVDSPVAVKAAEFFENYKDKKYSPKSDTPGFQFPKKSKIWWITADPTSPYYQNEAKKVQEKRRAEERIKEAEQYLQATFFDAGNHVLGNLINAVSVLKSEEAYEIAKEKMPYEKAWIQQLIKYRQDRARHFQAATAFPELEDYPLLMNMSPVSPHIYLALSTHARFKPAAKFVGALVGNSAFPGITSGAVFNYQAGCLHTHFVEEQEYSAAIKQALKDYKDQIAERYVPTLFMALEGRFSAPMVLYDHDLQSRQELSPLPYTLAKEILREKDREKIAKELARDVMFALRDKLPKSSERTGNERTIEAWLTSFYEDNKNPHPPESITIHHTDRAYNKYEVDEASELKPFYDIFANPIPLDRYNFFTGRTKQEENNKSLKAEDFYQLFFNGKQEWAVKNDYEVKAWPPEFIIPGYILPSEQHVILERKNPGWREELDELQKERDQPLDMWTTEDDLVLFWTSDSKDAVSPQEWTEVKEEVIRAYKFMQGRKTALKKASDIAKALEDATLDNWPEVRTTLKKDFLFQQLEKENVDLGKMAKELDITVKADKSPREIFETILTEKKKSGFPTLVDRVVLEQATKAAQKDWANKKDEEKKEDKKKDDKSALKFEDYLKGDEFKETELKFRTTFGTDSKGYVEENLQEGIQAFLLQKAAEVGSDPIELKGVSEWVKPGFGFFSRGMLYKKYELPKGVIPYPREDMTQQLHEMAFRKGALKISNDFKLNQHNNQLWKDVKKRSEIMPIQILTNEPRSLYYVAVITEKRETPFHEFYFSFLGSAENLKPEMQDAFSRQIYQELAKQFQSEVSADMRAAANYKV